MRVIKFGQKVEYCKECNNVSVMVRGPSVKKHQQAIMILISVIILLSLKLAKLHI